jgi:hypothetical protein
LLIGIGDYVLSHGPWSLHFAELGANDPPPPWLESWDGDGVIFRGESRRIARVIDGLRLPKVDLTPSRCWRIHPGSNRMTPPWRTWSPSILPNAAFAKSPFAATSVSAGRGGAAAGSGS